ncbi:hypothetical protein B0H14DRAFT_3463146 [Mycena olivaceomarginata]|nr:hypothetical protein B0H14DRAFT_3463146 [Mycena olivaceomarginata]
MLTGEIMAPLTSPAHQCHGGREPYPNKPTSAVFEVHARAPPPLSLSADSPPSLSRISSRATWFILSYSELIDEGRVLSLGQNTYRLEEQYAFDTRFFLPLESECAAERFGRCARAPRALGLFSQLRGVLPEEA